MLIGVGCDLIEIERVKKACDKEAFLSRIYTERERRQVVRRHPVAADGDQIGVFGHLAKRPQGSERIVDEAAAATQQACRAVVLIVGAAQALLAFEQGFAQGVQRFAVLVGRGGRGHGLRRQNEKR